MGWPALTSIHDQKEKMMSKKKAIHLVGADGRVMCNGQDWMERTIPVAYYRHLIDTRPISLEANMAYNRVRADVADLFARGIVLEENPSTQSEAITAYLKVLDMDPMHAAAHINLGTLYYNRQEYALAERHYRSAIQIDPRYALAHFDLGNVLDETGRVEEAISTYKTAIQLAPTYANAHYSIALAYEKVREPRKALQHWHAYVKLDTTGPWTVHAKHQIRRILQGDSLKLVHSRKAN
jgi:tetratricopeptide (TPR) repeat protein